MPYLHQEKKDGCEILLFQKSKNVFEITLQLIKRPKVFIRTVDTLQEACRIVAIFREVITRRDEMYPIGGTPVGHDSKKCSCCGN